MAIKPTCVLRRKQGGDGGVLGCGVAADGVYQLRIKVSMQRQLVEHHVLWPAHAPR